MKTINSIAIGRNAKAKTSDRLLPGATCNCGCGLEFDQCLKTKYANLPADVRRQSIKNRIFAVFPTLSETDLDRCVDKLFSSI